MIEKGVKISDILSENVLDGALRHVSRKKRVPGIDGISGRDLPDYWEKHGADICQKIRTSTYRPEPLYVVPIPKTGSREKRRLEIPCTIDRMILYAIQSVLGKYYEPRFLSESHGFRTGKGCHSALTGCLCRLDTNIQYVIDLDIRHFFDKVDHEILFSILQRDIKSKALLSLIKRYLNPIVIHGSHVYRKKRGLSQGSALSPLLANIYLHEFDSYLHGHNISFIRYADDILVFCQSGKEAYEQLLLCRTFLKSNLKLQLNEEKTKIVTPEEVTFLGYSFTHESDKQHGKYALTINEKTKNLMLLRMKKSINRGTGDNVIFWQRIGSFNQGWINYYYRTNPADMVCFLHHAEQCQMAYITEHLSLMDSHDGSSLYTSAYDCRSYYSLMGWYQKRYLKNNALQLKVVNSIMANKYSYWRSGDFFYHSQLLLAEWTRFIKLPFYYKSPSSVRIFPREFNGVSPNASSLNEMEKLVLGILAAGKNMTSGQIAGYMALCSVPTTPLCLSEVLDHLFQRRLIKIEYIHESGHELSDTDDTHTLKSYRLSPLSKGFIEEISAPSDYTKSIYRVEENRHLRYFFYMGTIIFNQIILNFAAYMPRFHYFEIDQLYYDKKRKVVPAPLYISTKIENYYFWYIESDMTHIIYQAIYNWKQFCHIRKRICGLVLVASSLRIKDCICKLLVSDKELHGLSFQNNIFVSTAESWFSGKRGKLISLRYVLESDFRSHDY